MNRHKTVVFLSGILALSMLCSQVTVFAEGSDFELEDIKPVKDAVCEVMGEETIVGAACTADELNRNAIQALIEKHFNAVTFGNELKPDSLFGYSNGQCPGTYETELNGEIFVAPKMSFKRPDRMCDIILKWNEENPEDKIRVRGHVLVWHAQTPEWFFHEDYDKKKDYVSQEEMSKRLEWYIREVLTHYTGQDSIYKDLFYGWDVVNEAISDATNSYRTDSENPSESLGKDTHGSNSSWWHVYQSNEYIIEAFRYANKYAPDDLDLYYNDYNETNFTKAKGIVKLIEDVQAADGTRIDGMGMQGHYSSTDMIESKFESSAKMFLDTGVKIMITEWDLKAADSYDASSEESMVTEYTRQGHRYEGIYNTLLKLKNEGYDIAGFTFWGTIDKFSWLQSSSNVGGGSTKSRRQCPLLFDDDYKAKPSYWAFVDQDRINDMVTEYKAKVKAEKEAAETEVVEPEIVTAEVESELNPSEPETATVSANDDILPNGRSKKGIIGTCITMGILVLIISLIVQKASEKRGPKNKKRK